MTQNQKELLLSDLSARVPYGVKASTKVGGNITISFIGEDTIIGEDGDSYDISFITPYLFSLSSMTEKQKKELNILRTYVSLNKNKEYLLFDWLNKNHFDYRGLIEKSLALDATNLGIYE